MFLATYSKHSCKKQTESLEKHEYFEQNNGFPGHPRDYKGFPGHALHEKDLQRQIAVGTLVKSQQRRALAVPRLNRGSTACQPDVLFPTGLHRIFFVRACEETFRTVVYGTLEG